MPEMKITISQTALTRLENAFGATGAELKEKVKKAIKKRVEVLENFEAQKAINLKEFDFNENQN